MLPIGVKVSGLRNNLEVLTDEGKFPKITTKDNKMTKKISKKIRARKALRLKDTPQGDKVAKQVLRRKANDIVTELEDAANRAIADQMEQDLDLFLEDVASGEIEYPEDGQDIGNSLDPAPTSEMIEDELNDVLDRGVSIEDLDMTIDELSKKVNEGVKNFPSSWIASGIKNVKIDSDIEFELNDDIIEIKSVNVDVEYEAKFDTNWVDNPEED